MPTSPVSPPVESAQPTEVHGHEVIAMILESQQAYTRESLARGIVDRFGAETRFFTCSAAGMTAPELVQFLESRGKFMPLADGFTIDPDRVCQH
jgi:probable metal-binding protein